MYTSLHTGTVPASLGKLGRLRVLDLHHNLLSGTIPAQLSGLTQARRIDLSNNRYMTGLIPASLCDIVEKLRASGVSVGGGLVCLHIPVRCIPWLTRS